VIDPDALTWTYDDMNRMTSAVETSGTENQGLRVVGVVPGWVKLASAMHSSRA